jgi:hypothetical protein
MKMTKSQKKLVDLIRAEGPLGYTVLPDGSRQYWLSKTSRLVSNDVSERLVRSVWLRPSMDGIFGETQTYIVKDTK